MTLCRQNLQNREYVEVVWLYILWFVTALAVSFPTPPAFGSCCFNMTELFWGSEWVGWGVGVCKVTHCWSCAWVCVPPPPPAPENVPPSKKRQGCRSPEKCFAWLTVFCFYLPGPWSCSRLWDHRICKMVLSLFSTALTTTDVLIIFRTYPFKLPFY